MNYWLAKSEPGTYSIDDLKKEKETSWDGVRNYQARNFLMEMKKGDLLLFYHSNTTPPAAVGVGVISKEHYPDPTQFDKKSQYYDEKASKESPRWHCPSVKFKKKFKREVSLAELKADKALKDLQLTKKGNRLSVMPLSKKEYEVILKLGEA